MRPIKHNAITPIVGTITNLPDPALNDGTRYNIAKPIQIQIWHIPRVGSRFSIKLRMLVDGNATPTVSGVTIATAHKSAIVIANVLPATSQVKGRLNPATTPGSAVGVQHAALHVKVSATGSPASAWQFMLIIIPIMPAAPAFQHTIVVGNVTLASAIIIEFRIPPPASTVATLGDKRASLYMNVAAAILVASARSPSVSMTIVIFVAARALQAPVIICNVGLAASVVLQNSVVPPAIARSTRRR